MQKLQDFINRDMCFASAVGNFWKNSTVKFEGFASILFELVRKHLGFPSGSDGKESACNMGDRGSIPGSEDPPREANCYPL